MNWHSSLRCSKQRAERGQPQLKRGPQKGRERGFASRQRAVIATVLVAAACLAGIVGRARADAPLGRYALADGEDAVFDSKTGLTWQRAVPSTAYSQNAALAYCAVDTGLSGVGWRLPSVKELQTIVDESRWSPAIDTTAFPSSPAQPFWTSSALANTTNAWGVHFESGNTFSADASLGYLVRCVR